MLPGILSSSTRGEGVTGTENGDFGVFIPDFDGERRPIYFVHKQNVKWVPEKSDCS